MTSESWRAYCRNCDWELVATDDDVHSAREYVFGKAHAHEGKTERHPTEVEPANDVYESPPTDGGMQLCGTLNSEDDLQQWLEEYFETHGWTAIREVSPHYSDYSADLLVQHDDYGWLGIETKYFHNDGGGKAANAHHQITRQYRGEKYIGEKINLWAICPYFWGANSPDAPYYDLRPTDGQFIREFFCRHGIGYIGLDRRQLLIDFAYSDQTAKIPVGGDRISEYEDAVDINRIRESVARKREKFDYKNA